MKLFCDQDDFAEKICDLLFRFSLNAKSPKTLVNTEFPGFQALAGAEGLEPSKTVLETGMLPLHHAPA